MSRLSIDIPDAIHRALKSEASLRGMSLRDYVLRRLHTPDAAPRDREAKTRFSDSGLAGFWSDRADMADPGAWVRERRQGRDFGLPESNAD